MASETGLQPEMANVDRQNEEDLPVDTEQSDDLFGDEPVGESEKSSEPITASSDVSNNIASTDATSDVVDPQPSSGAAPVTEKSSGIEGVAKYLPSNANLNQPTVSPSEPLGDGEARIDEDTQMTDVPASLATESAPPPTSEQQATEGSKPVGADSAVATTPTADQPTAADQPITSDLLNGTSDESKPADDQTSTPTDLSNGTMIDSKPNTEAAPTSKSALAATSSAVATPADREMSDAPSSGVVRAREDDDEEEASSEPAAKRAKTADANHGDAKPEFKKPDASTTNGAAPSAQPIAQPAQVNGHAVPKPKTPHFSSGPMTKTQKTFLIEKMKNTKKVKSAFWFTKPVDIVALNIPHYPNIIKQPMDLTTMEQKLKSDDYSSVDDLVADFELMVMNCITFNGIDHVASVSAQTLRAYFMKQMEMCPTGEAAIAKPAKPVKKASPKPTQPRREPTKPATGAPAKTPNSGETFALMPGGMPMIRRDSTTGRPKRAVIPPAPRDLPYASSKPKRKEAQTGLKFCEHILEEFRKPKWDRVAGPFRVPVDPVALNIPTYFGLIKHPMDISTITNKLKGGQYSSAHEFKADFDLMFTNCFRFNPPDNVVHQIGKEFQVEFDREWSRKDVWIRKHTPQSQRASPASDESDGDESEEAPEVDDDAEHDSNEATIALLREQLANMQNMVASIAQGGKRASPKAANNKKKKSTGGGASKPSKKAGAASSNSRPTIKTAKPKKQRLVTYDEKQEISNATEHMSGDQVEKLTNIITENVTKYKDMAGDDVELEIDDLPNDVQHKLLRYVRSIFPKQEPVEDANAIDDDYEPERTTGRSGGAVAAAKKKHKPMKKYEQESRIQQLKEQMAAMSGNVSGIRNAAAPAQSHPDSSDDDDSESSEEE